MLASLPYLMKGWGQTALLAFGTIALSLLAGVLLGAVASGRNAPLRWALALYVNFVRGVPVLIFIFLAYFLLPQTGVRLSDTLTVLAALVLYGTSLVLENVRGAIAAVGHEQVRSAVSLGMSGLQTLVHVVAPQAATIAAPLLLNTAVHLIKCTAFVSIVGVWELSFAAREVTERTLAPFQVMFTVMLMYYAMCYPLGKLAERLEARAAAARREPS
ncbi:amino acid ABC transporter permease [Comamonadaceae bacterium G21597-S1]|nr:amino acid ABC transporter permease [Comamonadaceae bacterium G21597-S1]